MAITVEQIHQTADSLAQQGIKPTQTNVREALGGGSFTTIAEALKSWRQEQETVTQLQAVVIPQDITDRTQTLTAQIWETAQALANERLTKEREALAHKEALAIAEVDEAQAVVITLENEQAELLQKLDELSAQLVTTQSELEQATAQNQKQAEQLKLLETQLTASTERASDLAERLEQQTQATTKQANIITELKTENATLETKNKNFIERLHHSESEVKKAQEYGERNMKDLAGVGTEFGPYRAVSTFV